MPPAFTAGGFRCEPPEKQDEIGAFLADGTALDHQSRGLSRTYLAYAVDDLEGALPVAYFTLQADAVLTDEKTQQPTDHLGSIPALKITRLGVRNDQRGRRLGSYLLSYIEMMAIRVGRVIGVRYLTLDAVADKVEWYKGEDFVETIIEQPTAEAGLATGDRSMWKDISDVANRPTISIEDIAEHPE